jgi:hypothetical protein
MASASTGGGDVATLHLGVAGHTQRRTTPLIRLVIRGHAARHAVLIVLTAAILLAAAAGGSGGSSGRCCLAPSCVSVAGIDCCATASRVAADAAKEQQQEQQQPARLGCTCFSADKHVWHSSVLFHNLRITSVQLSSCAAA